MLLFAFFKKKKILSPLIFYACFSSPQMSWFAVGSYYLLIGNMDTARRHFAQAAHLDPLCPHVWIGAGHAHAKVGDQPAAVAAYSTAVRLAPGAHAPLLFLGMQHAVAGNLALARQFLLDALKICGTQLAGLFLFFLLFLFP